jgi:hypothetical protein
MASDVRDASAHRDAILRIESSATSDPLRNAAGRSVFERIVALLIVVGAIVVVAHLAGDHAASSGGAAQAPPAALPPPPPASVPGATVDQPPIPAPPHGAKSSPLDVGPVAISIGGG